MCPVGESNSYDIHLFSSSDSGASLAVFWDNMLFYVLFAIWIVWNVRVMIQARRVYRAINDNPVGRVGSDLEKASIKKKKDAAKALDKEQDVLDGTNKPKFTGREARVEKDISTRKKKKDDLKLSITRYPDDQKTLRLRRAFVAADYMGTSRLLCLLAAYAPRGVCSPHPPRPSRRVLPFAPQGVDTRVGCFALPWQRWKR